VESGEHPGRCPGVNVMLRYLDDLRRAIRSMTRHWLFSVAVVLLLGLGASVAVVMLSFADAVLFRPLPVPRPEELVRVVQQLPRIGIMSSLPEAYYDNLRARTEAFAVVFGETGEFDHFAVTSPLPAERVSVRGVTSDFFTGLGVQPRDGRLFNDSDYRHDARYLDPAERLQIAGEECRSAASIPSGGTTEARSVAETSRGGVSDRVALHDDGVLPGH
jgi:hypothetical protein